VRLSDVLADLRERQPEEMPNPSLDRIRELAELLSDPQLSYPTIHLTGTNGKTTTARAAASIACSLGLTTGLYTSPHLLSVRERLSVCGEEISEAELVEEYGHLLPFLRLVDERAGMSVTYFETLTALAFLWFADKPVALGVFEVGMGGSWDATNVVAGDVSARSAWTIGSSGRPSRRWRPRSPASSSPARSASSANRGPRPWR
jgi:dihydrofolate synthase/folylpolyglutamate synthase